jgi:hypothetical protein
MLADRTSGLAAVRIARALGLLKETSFDDDDAQPDRLLLLLLWPLAGAWMSESK